MHKQRYIVYAGAYSIHIHTYMLPAYANNIQIVSNYACGIFSNIARWIGWVLFDFMATGSTHAHNWCCARRYQPIRRHMWIPTKYGITSIYVNGQALCFIGRRYTNRKLKELCKRSCGLGDVVWCQFEQQQKTSHKNISQRSRCTDDRQLTYNFLNDETSLDDVNPQNLLISCAQRLVAEQPIDANNAVILFPKPLAEQSHLNLFASRPQPKKKRKSRTAFTNHQIFELEKRFLYQKYLSPADRDEIAAALGLSNAQVISEPNDSCIIVIDVRQSVISIFVQASINCLRDFNCPSERWAFLFIFVIDEIPIKNKGLEWVCHMLVIFIGIRLVYCK